jgi:hypothetical protein
MNSLEQRKQLLVAESELNRAELAREWQAMAGEVRSLTGQARAAGSLVSAAVTLMAGLRSCHRIVTAPPGKKLSWWQILLKGAGVVSACWAEYGARPKS